MTGFPYRRGLVAGLAAIAGLASWWWVAATGVERAAFCAVLDGYIRPPVFITGDGRRGAAWEVRTRLVQGPPEAREAPVVVSIGDDAGGVFQASPPSPVDLAVVLRNLQRLGVKQAAIATVMAWDQPDPVSLKGLEIVLENFQRVIHAAPLSRGTLRQAMPPAFRRAALKAEAIQGDLSRLPIVNRVPVADVIFGKGETALAGFSSLDDTDAGNATLPLLARWEDENAVVLAFPLLAVLARYNLPVGGIEVKLGEFLRLGPSGPVLPIDRDGRMVLPAESLASRAAISAEALIVGTPDIFPAAPGLIVLRDDQSSATRATRRFSASLASTIASISSDAGLGPPCAYRRLPAATELAMLTGAVLLLTLGAARPRFERLIVCSALAAACLAAQWLALGMAQVWLPGIPLLGAIGVAALAGFFLETAPPPVQPVAAFAGPAAPLPELRRTAAIMGPKFRPVTLRREPLSRWEDAAPRVLEEAVVPADAVDLGDSGARQEEAAGRMAAPRGPGILPAAFVETPKSGESSGLAVPPPGNPADSPTDSKKSPAAGTPRQAARSAKRRGKKHGR